MDITRCQDILLASNTSKGYGDGTMKPEHRITREEVAVMLDRILQLENDTSQDCDLFFQTRIRYQNGVSTQ